MLLFKTGSDDKTELVSRYTWVYMLLWSIAIVFALFDVLPLSVNPTIRFEVMLGLSAVLRAGVYGTNASYIFSL